MVPSFKNTTVLWFFHRYHLFSFTTFQLQLLYYDIITDLICIIEKRQYLQNEKRYLKKKNIILLQFETPLKYAEKHFVSYTL